jgi:hypothetical protein
MCALCVFVCVEARVVTLLVLSHSYCACLCVALLYLLFDASDIGGRAVVVSTRAVVPLT